MFPSQYSDPSGLYLHYKEQFGVRLLTKFQVAIRGLYSTVLKFQQQSQPYFVGTKKTPVDFYCPAPVIPKTPNLIPRKIVIGSA